MTVLIETNMQSIGQAERLKRSLVKQIPPFHFEISFLLLHFLQKWELSRDGNVKKCGLLKNY